MSLNRDAKMRFLRIFYSLGAVLVISFFQSALAIDSWPPSGYREFNGKFTERIMNFDDRQGAGGRNFVSIAKLSGDSYVIANYSNLLIFRRTRADVCTVGIENGEFVSAYGKEQSAGVGSKRIYNPTGVVVSPSGRVFVANYKGNNILELDVDVQGCSARLIGELASKNSLGPENVAISEDGDVLVSANYDAGTVTAFSLRSGAELWSAQVPQAHGVAVSNGFVYATGLADRKIYEISLNAGKIARSVGGVGWNPMQNQFLWPTSVFVDSRGRLVVSDAHTGFVSRLNRKDFVVESFFGGNGPGERLFSYPYAAAVIGNEVVVLSFARTQVLFLDEATLQLKERFVGKGGGWVKGLDRVKPFGVGWVGYINESNHKIIKINGAKYKFGYGHLHPLSSGATLRVPEHTTALNPSGYLYFLDGVDSDRLSVFFSSSSGSLIGIMHRAEGPDLVHVRRIPQDSWLEGKVLYSGGGKALSIDDVEGAFLEFARRYDQLVKPHGWITLEDYFKAAEFEVGHFGVGNKNRSEDRAFYRDVLGKSFASVPGAKFFSKYVDCDYQRCTQQSVREAAREYFSAVDEQDYVNFDERAFVGMLSGVRPPSPPEVIVHSERVRFSDCGAGRYYAGFGVGALETRALDDYLSAESADTSFVCLHPEAGKLVGELHIGWLNAAEVPDEFEVVVVGRNGYIRSVLAGYGRDVVRSGGGEFSILSVPRGVEVATYMLRIIKGKGQGRLLLRSLAVK